MGLLTGRRKTNGDEECGADRPWGHGSLFRAKDGGASGAGEFLRDRRRIAEKASGGTGSDGEWKELPFPCL